ncbi:MAG: GH3 auxin-responsive promoter family protein, partial [Myxococcales bacterium]|nr:GH3 auxin-responsive promoter family protein [Myxococcales bacterium]
MKLVRAATAVRWRAFDRAASDPRAAQELVLRRITRRNASSEFGRKHGFDRIDSITAWRDAVPLADYETFAPAIERIRGGEQGILTRDRVTFFGQSSGTTGRPKFIPITDRFVAEVQRSRELLVRPALEHLPGILCGSALGVSSSRIVGWTEGGIPYGSVTARYDRKGWTDRFQMIPFEVYALEDFEAKYYLTLRLALESELSVVSTVNPSTVMLLAQKLDVHADRLIADLRRGTVDPALPLLPAVRFEAEQRIKGPRPKVARRLEAIRRTNGFLRWVEVWPKMAAIFCWKAGAASFYLRQFPKHFGPTPVFDLGFAATEGIFSAPLHPDRDDGVLTVDGHFMEFIPEGRRDEPTPPCLDASELEAGGRYYIVITTSGGLYRYDLNDVIEVTDFYKRAPMVRFLHKGGGIVSITGEKLA